MLVTTVTSYKTSDGKLFDSEQEAIDYELEWNKNTFTQTLASRLLSNASIEDTKPIINSIKTAFKNKNTRNIIRQMLDLFAEPGNDQNEQNP